MRLLIVEDSVRLQQSLTKAFRHSGYVVDVVGDGEEGLWCAESRSYDVIVLDLMLPKLSGLEVLAKLRAKGGRANVLLLTARDSVDDRVRGLNAGADDYLVKPFALDELIARVDSLCRRAYGQKQSHFACGEIEIDFSKRLVSLAGRVVQLTPREYRILEYMARRMGEVITRTELEEHIYDGSVEPMSNVVDAAVCVLRKKLSSGAEAASLIKTRRGHGYVFGASAA